MAFFVNSHAQPQAILEWVNIETFHPKHPHWGPKSAIYTPKRDGKHGGHFCKGIIKTPFQKYELELSIRIEAFIGHSFVNSIYDTLRFVRIRIFSVRIVMVLLIASKRFREPSVVPSYLVRKVENMIFPCMFNFGERKGQVWLDHSPRVRTDEKNSEDAV